MFQLVCQAAVQAERLQLQPDEPETVIVKKDEQARGALWTREAMTRYQPCSIETEPHRNINVNLYNHLYMCQTAMVHKHKAHIDNHLDNIYSALLELKN